ncbi:maleate cis-trans isomerase family protein [Nocardia blacklockiae]|uniref:maleate cis-trans isomerase family protein n=1 Tax=Nocardia blacklockiae TaxID=480036 RepID=UPI001892E586|nr:arylmalonate decarboxylase [Nocardia blacklockiae]MBF6170405.1 arylmalonate decarboxylase [Nocardia blacklockiae]
MTAVGVAVPPANPAVEPEFARLLGARADLHVTRFPVQPGRALAARLSGYNAALPETIRSFGGLRLDAFVSACSGSRYLLGPADDRRECAELSTEFGLPVASATEAIRCALAHLGVDELVLVSPYQPWLTACAERFWTAAGLRITRVVAVRAGTRFAPYEVDTDQLVAQVEQAAPPRDAALLLTGTGMRTLRAIELLTARAERIVLSSNTCSVWWALNSAGLPARLGCAGADRVAT